LALITLFDPWGSKTCTCPRKYSLSPYTGCSHRCLYCYITAYIPNPFEARPKKDFIKRLSREIPKVDLRIPIAVASSSDPYLPLEAEMKLTRHTIRILRDWSARYLLMTKSDLITRDVDILRDSDAAVSITITTLDDATAGKLEPSAPRPGRRLKAVETLVNARIPCSARIDPIIPGINSEEKQLLSLIKELAAVGVKHITASTYKAKPDSYGRLIRGFPDLEEPLRKFYWRMGERKGGARYLPLDMRLDLIRRIKWIAESQGMSFASCREELIHYNSGASCDSSHLIPVREVLTLRSSPDATVRIASSATATV
jgi:DNA repair photolyase